MNQEAMATMTAIETVSIAVESMVTVVAMVSRVDGMAVAEGSSGSHPAEAAVGGINSDERCLISFIWLLGQKQQNRSDPSNEEW